MADNRLRLQMELKLQNKMKSALHSQGWYAEKTSDRFKAGRPDLRIGNKQFGQLDIELKYRYEGYAVETEVGMTKLQWLTIKDMNEHCLPAVCLVYSEPLNVFFITTLLRDVLPPPSRRVLKLPGSDVIDGATLFTKSMEHLYDIGYCKNIGRTRR